MMDWLKELKLRRALLLRKADSLLPNDPFWSYDDLREVDEELVQQIMNFDALINVSEAARWDKLTRVN